MGPAAFRRYLPALVSFAVCACICSASLRRRSLWIDELVTFDIARLPFFRQGWLGNSQPFTHSILGYSMQDPGPGPLMYLLDGLFARLAYPMGGEHWLRLPGIAAGILSSALTYLFLRKRTGLYASTCAALVTAALPLLVDFYTGSRGYGWLILISLVQWWLITTISIKDSSWGHVAGFIAASVAGLLINPMHTLWTGVLLVAFSVWLLLTKSRLSRSTAILLIAVTAAIHLGWLYLWFYSMKASSTGTAATVRGSADAGFILRRMLQQTPVLAILAINTTLAVPLLFYRGRGSRLQGVIGVCATVGSLLLLAALCSRFFAAPRYFYAPLLCSILSGAFLTRPAFAWLRLRMGRWAPPLAMLVISVGLVGALSPEAYCRAGTPQQDWWKVAEYLKARTQPGDIVLTGPNSEFEVYRAYAKAAQVPAQAPLLIEDSNRRQHKLDRAEGLQLLLQRGGRLWFVTASYGTHRTPQFWQLIGHHFTPVVEIKGRSNIYVLKYEPAGGR